jgi:hypothetical protein
VVRVRMGYQSIDKILRHYARLNCSTKPIRLGSTVVQYGRIIAKNSGMVEEHDCLGCDASLGKKKSVLTL